MEATDDCQHNVFGMGVQELEFYQQREDLQSANHTSFNWQSVSDLKAFLKSHPPFPFDPTCT